MAGEQTTALAALSETASVSVELEVLPGPGFWFWGSPGVGFWGVIGEQQLQLLWGGAYFLSLVMGLQ